MHWNGSKRLPKEQSITDIESAGRSQCSEMMQMRSCTVDEVFQMLVVKSWRVAPICFTELAIRVKLKKVVMLKKRSFDIFFCLERVIISDELYHIFLNCVWI